MAALSLLGKVALVTGAARGIGLACAQSLARHGAKVLLADVDFAAAKLSSDELEGAGFQATAVECNVCSKDEIQAMVQKAVTLYGGLDICVANAGIVRSAPFLEMTEADFDLVIQVNLKGTFLTCQAAARQMVAQLAENPKRGGAIITMSSVNAVMAIPTIAGYNASKGGVNNLTRCMALALSPHNIRVNAIGPGSINTEVLKAVAGDASAMSRILTRTPLGRIGDPSEIGEIAAFLASDASSYMTGQVLYADGGRMALNYTVPVPTA